MSHSPSPSTISVSPRLCGFPRNTGKERPSHHPQFSLPPSSALSARRLAPSGPRERRFQGPLQDIRSPSNCPPRHYLRWEIQGVHDVIIWCFPPSITPYSLCTPSSPSLPLFQHPFIFINSVLFYFLFSHVSIFFRPPLPPTVDVPIRICPLSASLVI